MITTHQVLALTRQFFELAEYNLSDLENDAFLLVPQGNGHPLIRYDKIYLRVIVGRPLTGEDFSEVENATRRLYTDENTVGDLAHRVAIVVHNQRPEPGARYRLYEIRQQSGLAILPLDSARFAQVQPDRSAINILDSDINQATGQQDLYAFSNPVSDDLSFFGRERVLQELIDTLDAGQMVGLFGLRKTGKTSLVQRLQGKLSHRRVIAIVDMQRTAREQGVWPIYPIIIGTWVAEVQRLRPDVVLPPLHLYPMPENITSEVTVAFLEDLHTLHTALGLPDAQGRLLLIIDEANRLLPVENTPGYIGFTTFLGQLRAASQQLHILDVLLVDVDPVLNRVERLALPGASQDNELYYALREIWVPPMTNDDVKEMIESLGSQMGIRYKPEALTVLAMAGGGHPFITRKLCSSAVAGRFGHGVVEVTEDQAREAIEEFVIREPYLSELWDKRFDETQRAMVRTLAQSAEPLSRTSLLAAAQRRAALAALNALENYTLVHREGDFYSLAWPVLRDWIRWVESPSEM
jgi:hypothetical protein